MMKGTTKKRYTLVSGDGQDLFEFQILAIFALKSARKPTIFRRVHLGTRSCQRENFFEVY